MHDAADDASEQTRFPGFELEPDSGLLKVTHVYRNGPADKDFVKIKVGDYVLAITGRPAKDWTAARAQHEIPPLGPARFVTDCVTFASRGAERVVIRATTADSKPKWQPWGSQIAGAASETVALAMFERIRSRHPELLSAYAPLVIRKRNPGMGPKPIANVRIGQATRAEAERLCSRLSAKGIACVALKN